MTQQQFDVFMAEQRKQTALLESLARRADLGAPVEAEAGATTTNVPVPETLEHSLSVAYDVMKPIGGPNNPMQITKPLQVKGKRR